MNNQKLLDYKPVETEFHADHDEEHARWISVEPLSEAQAQFLVSHESEWTGNTFSPLDEW